MHAGTLDEALAQLAAMPGFLEAALARVNRSRQTIRPAGGGFSLVEHACHLRDLEREGYGLRLRRLLAEDDPILEGFDGDQVAVARDYLSQDAAAAARDFAAARAELLRVVRDLGPAECAREGEFAGRRISLAGMVVLAAGHDAQHRGEIDALLAQLG